MSNNLLDELKWRGILNNVTNEEKLINATKKGLGAYIGFDPSAKSLHLGNYAAIMMLRRFKTYGLKTIALIGGATGMIGDPSGKSQERNLLDLETVNYNKKCIAEQLKKYAKVDEIVDNYDFYKDMTFLDFLRVVGKFINVNYMLEKETIKTRLETGISFTEFTYTLIQGYDFVQLYKNKGVAVQSGGSDQWGNITTGCEMIRKMVGDENDSCGLTLNLLLKSDGKKFGKSEKGAIFLDPELTSQYEMYQFLINQEDADVIRLLKYLTEMSQADIEALEKDLQTNPREKNAQKALAKEIVTQIHGEAGYNQAVKISNTLFGTQSPKELTKEELAQIYKTALNADVVNKEYTLVEFLTTAKIASSNREARELITNNSISINGDKVTDIEAKINDSSKLFKEYTIVKKGKRNCFIIKWAK